MTYTGKPVLRLKEILEALDCDFMLFELMCTQEVQTNHFTLTFKIADIGMPTPMDSKLADDRFQINCVWEDKNNVLAFAIRAATGIDASKSKKAAAVVNEINIPGGGWIGKSHIGQHANSKHLELIHSWDIALEDPYLFEAAQVSVVAKILKPNITRLLFELTKATIALTQKLSSQH